MSSATTSPTTGHNVHCPANQRTTTEYHRNVVGRKTKPNTGQSRVGNSPVNQVVKNQRITIASRGVSRAMIARRQGTP